MAQDSLVEFPKSGHLNHLSLDPCSLSWSSECQTQSKNISSSSLLTLIIDGSVTNQADDVGLDLDDGVSINNCDTHIEIIKAKPVAPRRVSGANRVVPLITSLWKNSSSSYMIIEPSLAKLYRTIIDSPDCSDDRECGICFLKLLSSFEVEQHVVTVHKQTFTSEQCFVCRRKYIFQTQLKIHLSNCHGIHYPNMICKICFMEFHSQVEKKAHERKHDKVFSCQFCSLKFASEYICQNHFDNHLVCLKPFQCSKCGKRFQNSISLSIHQKRHLQTLCSFCTLAFTEELDLLMHMTTHDHNQKENFLEMVEEYDDKENRFDKLLENYVKTSDALVDMNVDTATDVELSVKNCVEGLLTSLTLPISANAYQSKAIVSSKNHIECKLCGISVESGQIMIEHHRKSHLRNRTCLFCGRRSGSVAQTRRHMATHVAKLTALSNVAGGSDFPSKEVVKNNSKSIEGGTESDKGQGYEVGKLQENIQLHHISSDPMQQYNCLQCSQTFHNKISRDKHALICEHVTKSSISLQCTICSQSFLRPKFLERHMSQHKPSNNCHCVTCGKTFSTHTKLRAHLRSHAPADVRQKFKCSFCSISCSTFSGLKVHLRIHTGERPYSCDLCKKKFKRLQAMKKHLIIVHRGPDSVTHACRECPMKFNDRGNLFRHFLRVHRKFCRFICGICGRRYGQNQDLQRHLKMKHHVNAPSIKGKAKKSVSDIYIIPSLESLALSDTHAATIKKIMDEEKLKFKELEELGIMTDFPSDQLNKNQPLTTTTYDLLDIGLFPPGANTNDIQRASEFPPTIDSQDTPLHTFDECYIGTNNLTLPEMNSHSKLINHVGICPAEDFVQADFQPQFIPLLGLLAQVRNAEVSQLNAAKCNTSFKLQTCDLCNQLFYLDSKFKEHLQQRVTNSCTMCDTSFCDEEKLNHHFAKEHSTNTVYQCGICMVTFSSSDLIYEHMKNAHGHVDLAMTTSTLDCSEEKIAGIYDFKNDHLPSASRQSTHPISAPNISHTLNDFFLHNIIFQSAGAFSTLPNSIPQSYTSHNILPSQSIPPVFILQPSNISSLPSTQPSKDLHALADKVSGTESQSVLTPTLTSTAVCFVSEEIVCPLENHDSLKGKQEFRDTSGMKESNSMDCNQCGKHCIDKGRLKRHINIHLGSKPYACPHCNKSFGEKHNLKVHIRSHTGERPYSCGECGKKMRYQKEFADHQRMHEGLKPYECKDCGRKFLRLRELVRHGLTHSGEKRFKCDTCGKAFSRMDQFRLHSKCHTVPTADELLYCQFCSKGFKAKSQLDLHIVLHSGDKKHHCTLCTKSFATKYYLKSHLKTHKKQDTYIICPKCPRKFAYKDRLEVHLKKFHTKHKKHVNKVVKKEPMKGNFKRDVLILTKMSDRTADIDEDLEVDLAMQEAILDGVDILDGDKSSTIYFQMAQDDIVSHHFEVNHIR